MVATRKPANTGKETYGTPVEATVPRMQRPPEEFCKEEET